MRIGLGVHITDWWRRVSAAADGPFGNHATLTDDLVSYWDLDEQSGVRYDSITDSANDLTDNNTVGFVNLGPSGVVADFVGTNAEYLSLAADTISVEGMTGFTAAGWVKYDAALSGDSANGTWSSRGWNMYAINGVGVLTPRFYAYGNGENDFVDWSGTVADNTWVHFLVYWDGVNIGISIDGGTPVTAAHTTAIDDSGIAFNIGRTADAAGYLTGNWSRFAIWSRVITEDERTSLYNSGKGKSYSDLTDDEKVGLVSYWNLDEVSGVRYDSHGSNDLTDNNTVTSVTNSYPANMPGQVANFVAASSESLTRTSVVIDADFTAAFWFKGASILADKDIFGCGTTWPNSVQFHFRASPTTTSFLVGSGAAYVQAISALTTMNDGTWHLVIGTFTDSDKKARVYFDDVEGSSSPSAALAASHYSTAATLFMGGGGVLGANTLVMSSPMIWSRVLTSQERTDLYNAGNGLFY